ncbi:MAG: type II toxin-antitoxin system PemK/MazF family toxin [Leifsonia sp.]
MTDSSWVGSEYRRGQIVLVELDPARGSEQAKTRPAVIVSNDAANAAASANDLGVVTVVPLTSNTSRVRGYQVLIPAAHSGLPLDSKAQAEQVRAISTIRIVRPLGLLPLRTMAMLDDALRVHLAL